VGKQDSFKRCPSSRIVWLARV